MSSRIYVAASSQEIARAESAMSALRICGIKVSHDWTVPMRARAALGLPPEGHEASEDRRAIFESDGLWLLSPTTESTGSWWEFGYACGLRSMRCCNALTAPRPWIAISGGDGRCIFRSEANAVFDTDEEALEWIRRIAAVRP